VISYATLKGDYSFPGFKAAWPVLGSVMVIAFTGKGGGAASWLLTRPVMVFIGKASYSLYLWHWPVLVFLRAMSENPLGTSLVPHELVGPGCLVLSTALAFTSYAVIERPFRAWKWTPLASAFTMIGMMGFTSWSGLTQRTGTQLAEGFAPITVAGRLYSVNQNVKLSPAALKKYASVRMLAPEHPNPVDEGVVRPGISNAPLGVLVFGDSHSTMFAPMIDQILLKHRISGRFVIANAADVRLFKDRYEDSPNFGSAADVRRYDETRKKLLEVQRPKLTIWIQRYDPFTFQDMESSIQYVMARSTCIFLQQAPVLNTGDYCTIDVFGYLRNVAHKDLTQIRVVEPRSVGVKRRRFEDALLSKYGQNPHLIWFPTEAELTAPDGRVKWWDGVSKLYYLDDDHLSEYGVQLFRDRLEKLILEKLNLPSETTSK